MLPPEEPVKSSSDRVTKRPEGLDHDFDQRRPIVSDCVLMTAGRVRHRDDFGHEENDDGRKENSCPVRHYQVHYQRQRL